MLQKSNMVVLELKLKLIREKSMSLGRASEQIIHQTFAPYEINGFRIFSFFGGLIAFQNVSDSFP